MTDLAGRRVLVVGMARTGVAAARFLLQRGARVSCTDRKPLEELGPEVRELAARGCILRLGEARREDFLQTDGIVLSPGVPSTLAPLVEARESGVEIIGEVELAFRHLACPLVAVTGTNGKTTTVSLAHHILRESGLSHEVGGNIGTPLIELVTDRGRGATPSPPRLVLAEISSFQLETTVTFRPWIAAWTNLTPDHLDRYPDVRAYGEAKARIFRNQREGDYAVIPARDPWLEKLRPAIAARTLRFGPGPEGSPQVRLDAGEIRLRLEAAGIDEGYDTASVTLPGTHNLENAMVAVTIARLCGAPRAAVQAGLASFRGLPHRLEYVGERGGIRFYNDSKATTVASVVRALASFDNPVVLLAGGKDKGGTFRTLREALSRHVRQAVLFGAAADRMAAETAGACPQERATDLGDAVFRAWTCARPGDVILLSPACSSFDQFRDYEDRGDTFKQLVRRITREGGITPVG